MATKTSSGSGVPAERVRAFWAERQQMAGAMKGESPGAVLARTGWARSVGGCTPYLALRDRGGFSREAVDAAAAKLELHELPAARGCTYVVPAEDFAVALRASQGHGDDASVAQAKKFLGLQDKELDRLCRRVLDAVAKEPLDPAAIKEVVGDAVRSFGPEGKKRGVGTTLPLALGRLQTGGEIRRVPVEGRLDRQRYRYVRWDPSPLPKKRLADEEIALELARRFFRWTGPATVAQLAWWAGLGAKAAKAASAELGVVPLEAGGDRLLFADDRDALLAMVLPRAPRVSFVALLDNIVHMRREVLPHLDAEDAKRKVPGSDKQAPAGQLIDLPYHPIVDRGRIVGLWDWDGVKGALVYRLFGKPGAELVKDAKKAADALAAYVKSDLGDVRSFSLDSPESRVERIEALAKAKS
jgi:hypothetical protein